MNFDVSIIVPVYGAEKYIRACIDTVLNQTLKSLEVIIVNDCTKDNSMKICEELYGGNERVQLINQPRNMGAGEARNTGISKARGKYIGFVDSDDQIFPEMFETMFNTAEKLNADVVHNTSLFSVFPVNKDELPVDMTDQSKYLPFKIEIDFDPAKEVTLLDDDLDKRLENWLVHKYNWTIWNQIYRRDFLQEHNIRFSEMQLSEDFVFSITCLFLAKRYVLLPDGWYIYRPSLTSLSRSGNNPAGTLKPISSQIRGLSVMKNSLGKIPYFSNNPEKLGRVLEYMIRILENGYVRIAFQQIGEKNMRDSDAVHNFFVEEFGDKAEYVEFLFYELHKNYPPQFDSMAPIQDPKVWDIMRENYPKYKETGNLLDLWEGFKEM